jgi:hypothetical protein
MQARKASKAAGALLGNLQYQEDPNFTESQANLKQLGDGLLKGEVPDYYKSIGEMGGSEFENALAMTNRDISQSAAEAAASNGRARGGYLPAVTAGSIADNAMKMRYADYERALAGKKGLLDLGVNVEQGVRAAGFDNMTGENNFNSMKTQAQIGLEYRKAADQAAVGIGTIGAVSSAVAGGALAAGGGFSSLLDKLFAKSGSAAASGLSAGAGATRTGVSGIGSISDAELSDRFATLALRG